MFLGRNRYISQSPELGEAGTLGAGENIELFNKNQDMPIGMQRFLAKKGISSSNDLANRTQFAPRVSFRRAR